MSSSSSGPEGRAKDAAVEVAEKVASLIRKHSAMELFRARVRECAAERLAAQEEGRRRADQRREEARKHGVLYGNELPAKASPEHVSWLEAFSGRVVLPSNVKPPADPTQHPEPAECIAERKKAIVLFFEYVKVLGFPDESPENGGEVGTAYEFDVHVWLPPELHPSLDPDSAGPLPVPNRVVTTAEKFAALAAVHDADPLGNEKIDPWATAEAAADAPPLWRRQPCPEGNWYFLLLHSARQMGDREVAAAQRWLEEVQRQVKGGPEDLSDPITLEQTANLLGYEVKTLYNDGSFPPPRVPARGRQPARYSYRDARAWALENRPKRASGMPEDYEDAKRRFLGPPQVSSQEVKAR